MERIIYGGDLTDATAADKARAKAHVGWKHAIVATLDQVHAAHEVEEVQRAVSPHIVLQPLPATESDEDADEYDEADYDNMIDGFVPNAPPFNVCHFMYILYVERTNRIGKQKPLSMRTALIMAQSYDPSATASEEEKEDHPETQSPDVDTDYDSEILVLTAAEETLVLLRRASNPNHVALDDDSLTLSEEEERWIRLKRAANGRNA